MTPPFGLLLAQLPVGSEAGLVAELRARDIEVPDAHGTVDAVRRFSSRWLAGTGLSAEPLFEQRLFRLTRLVPPDPPSRSCCSPTSRTPPRTASTSGSATARSRSG